MVLSTDLLVIPSFRSEITHGSVYHSMPFDTEHLYTHLIPLNGEET